MYIIKKLKEEQQSLKNVNTTEWISIKDNFPSIGDRIVIINMEENVMLRMPLIVDYSFLIGETQPIFVPMKNTNVNPMMIQNFTHWILLPPQQ